MAEKEQKKSSNKLPLILIIILVAAVAGIMTVRQVRSNGKTGCQTMQSAFGQAQSQTWVQMNTAAQAAIGAGFELNYPDTAVNTDYDSVQYWSYTQQIDEHRYYSGDKEVFRIAKGKMCGEALYTPTSTYASTVIAQVNGHDVTEYGDGSTVTAVSWVDGAYSYFIGCFGKPESKEEIEQLAAEVN